MVLLGMLHHRAHPKDVQKAYAYAAVAKVEGVDFFYFSPGKVNIHKQSIMGKVYDKGNWVDKEFPFPDVIFNASGPATSKAEDIVNYLYDRIPFTSHSIGNKMSVYKRIKEGGEYEPYLIPSETYKDFETFDIFANRFDKIVMKPVSGHQGGGILFIEREGKAEYKINENGETNIYSEKALKKLLMEHTKEQEYLIQPFIMCKIKSGHVYDFRLHVQKNGEGRWVITSIYPRIGQLGTFTSNMSNGGYTAYLKHFLKNEFGNKWFDVYQQLKWFSLNFPVHFETLYKGDSFDELGIDIGVDQKRKLWIFEVNWRPGAPMIFDLELDVAKNTIQYAKYLAAANKN
ncbi:YheC/YheD family protein [Heyndrickxia acidicola]|uniref:YheC/YheD family protein n=1 Tax=Heyndrickxia acidicola TaxID=209389 RepID=A0ABU6MM27_9BACI|nr:YheC/YheD family protein [Heyndrickxia acidicola]MED1205736.1 YheC/YheD family protein [Heyndrickxia acidicola]